MLLWALWLVAGVFAQCDDCVSHLPGYNGPLKEKNYAGYAPVRLATQGHLFYHMATSRAPHTPETPVMLWLNGGPGESSLLGFYYENGPYAIQPDGTLKDNPHTWNQLAHVLYVDQPVGTGFSYCSKDGYVTNEREVARDMHTALTWLLHFKHPEFAGNPLYLTGESYAGKYVPYVAEYIHEANRNASGPTLNLKGIAVGNGIYDPIRQFESQARFWRDAGLAGPTELAAADITLRSCAQLVETKEYAKAFSVCNGMSDKLVKEAGTPFLYDVRSWGNPIASWTGVLSKYLNTKAAREALHVGNHTWFASDGTSVPNPVTDHLINDIMQNNTQVVVDLIETGQYVVVIYNGVYDGSVCNHRGTGEVLDALWWSGRDEFRSAPQRPFNTSGGVTAGWSREAKTLSWVMVANSGHLVPLNQPEAALAMLKKFLLKS